MTHQIFVYTAPWTPCTDKAEKNRLHAEAMLEIDPEHPMGGLEFEVIARRNDNDDILVRIVNGVFDFAVIHLTWSGKVEQGDLPDTSFWITQKEWAERCMREAIR